MSSLETQLGAKIPSDLKSNLDQATWTVANSTHVFYTNPDYSKFLWDSNKKQGLSRTDLITIEDTPGWQVVKAYDFNANAALREHATRYASLKYAQAAEGPVYALVYGSTEAPLFGWSRRNADQPQTPRIRPLGFERAARDSTWLEVELPALLTSSRVASINNAAVEGYRSFLTKSDSTQGALRRISRDIADQALRLPNSSGSSPSGGGGWSLPGGRNAVIAAAKPSVLKFDPATDTEKLMSAYGQMPGGILCNVAAQIENKSGGSSSIKLNENGELIIGGAKLETTLNPEELLTIIDAVYTSGGTSPFGAINGNETIGVDKRTAVGATLLGADFLLNELMFGWLPDRPHYHQAKVPNITKTVLEKLAARDYTTIALEVYYACVEDGKGAILDLRDVKYKIEGGRCQLASYSPALGYYSVGSHIPGLLSPLVNSEKELETMGLEQFKHTKVIRDNFATIIQEEGLLAKAVEYLCVASLIRGAIVSRTGITISQELINATSIREYEYTDIKQHISNPSTASQFADPSAALKRTVDSLVSEYKADIGKFGRAPLIRGLLAYKLAHRYGYEEGRYNARVLMARALVKDGASTSLEALPKEVVVDALRIIWFPDQMLPEIAAKFGLATSKFASASSKAEIPQDTVRLVNEIATKSPSLPFEPTLEVFNYYIKKKDPQAGLWLGRLLYSSQVMPFRKHSGIEVALEKVKTIQGLDRPRFMLEVLKGAVERAGVLSDGVYLNNTINFDTTLSVFSQLQISLEEVGKMKSLLGSSTQPSANLQLAANVLSHIETQIRNKIRLSSKINSNDILLQAIPLVANTAPLPLMPPQHSSNARWSSLILNEEAALLKKSPSEINEAVKRYQSMLSAVRASIAKQPQWMIEDVRLFVPYITNQFRKTNLYGAFQSNTLFESIEKGGWNCFHSSVAICELAEEYGHKVSVAGVTGHAVIKVDDDFYFDTTIKRAFKAEDVKDIFGPINWIDSTGHISAMSTLLPVAIAKIETNVEEAKDFLRKIVNLSQGTHSLGKVALGYLELTNRAPGPQRALKYACDLLVSEPNSDSLSSLLRDSAKALGADSLARLLDMYTLQENPGSYIRIQNMGVEDVNSQTPAVINHGCQSLLEALSIIVHNNSSSFAILENRQRAWEILPTVLKNLALGYEKLNFGNQALAALGSALLITPRDFSLRIRRGEIQALAHSPNGILSEIDAGLALDPRNQEIINFKKRFLNSSLGAQLKADS